MNHYRVSHGSITEIVGTIVFVRAMILSNAWHVTYWSVTCFTMPLQHKFMQSKSKCKTGKLRASELKYIVALHERWAATSSQVLRPNALLQRKQIRDFETLRLAKPRLRDGKKHTKTRIRDPSQRLPRFRDRTKICRDPRFSRYHSPPLL